jgi:DNA polymerase III alpha subunit
VGLPLFAPLVDGFPEPQVALPTMGLGQHIIEDYRVTGLSLKHHPLALLRDELDKRRVLTNGQLLTAPPDERIKVAGLAIVRQQPATASGVIFMMLEDETGIANIVVWRKVFERFRPIVMGAKLVEVTGWVQREGEVIHVVADRFVDLSPLLRQISEPDQSDIPELRINGHDCR